MVDGMCTHAVGGNHMPKLPRCRLEEDLKAAMKACQPRFGGWGRQASWQAPRIQMAPRPQSHANEAAHGPPIQQQEWARQLVAAEAVVETIDCTQPGERSCTSSRGTLLHRGEAPHNLRSHVWASRRVAANGIMSATL